jgi:hypothetical protein
MYTRTVIFFFNFNSNEQYRVIYNYTRAFFCRSKLDIITSPRNGLLFTVVRLDFKAFELTFLFSGIACKILRFVSRAFLAFLNSMSVNGNIFLTHIIVFRCHNDIIKVN